MTRSTLYGALAAALITGTALAQNDDCGGALPLPVGSTAFDNSAATDSVPAFPCGGPGGADLWYVFTAPNAACYSFQTCNSGFDTVLEVFTGNCGALNSFVCNDDNCGIQSRIDYPASAGEILYVRVGGFAGATGAGSIDVIEIGPPLVNDDCPGALPLSIGTVNYDTTAACLSPPDWPCGSQGGPDLWYSFTAPNNALYTIDTCGSSYDTALQLFDGTCSSLNPLSCNDDACGVQSSITFAANTGNSFRVRVGGWNNSVGTGQITVTEVTPAVVNNVAHYRLDEASGTVCLDASPNANHGTYVGGIALGQAGANAGTGTSADFNGIHNGTLVNFDGYVSIGAIPALDDLRNDLSVAAWINLNQLPQGLPAGSGINRIFGNQGPSGGWSFGVTGAPGFRFTTHGILDYNLTTPLSAGQWTHVAAVFDLLGDVTFYVDGLNVGTVPGSGSATAPGSEYHIGVWTPINPASCMNGGFSCQEFFDGLLDDVQVYEGALSDGDVAFLFANPGDVVTGSGPIGTNYCGPAIPNSSGMAGVMSANGSNNPANNNLTLTASQLPAGQFGYFLAGQTQGFFNPPGSSGIICLQVPIGRFNQVSDIITGPQGSIVVDLTAMPLSPPVAVMSGDSWNFQCWFRDGGTNNFTDGINIQF